MSSAVALSPQDLEDLHQIRSALPSADPRIAQIDELVKAQQQQPTDFEKERQPATGSTWQRLTEGASSALKNLLPSSAGDVASEIGRTVGEVANGTLIPHIGYGAYEAYKGNRNEGQGVLPSIASAVGNLAGVDSEGIRKRAMQGDYAEVVGESLPHLVSTAVGEGLAEVPWGRAASKIIRNDANEVAITPSKMLDRIVPLRTDAMPTLQKSFALTADIPERQAGIPRVGMSQPDISFVGPKIQVPQPKPRLGDLTFEAPVPERQAGIPRVASETPSVRFGPEPPAPKPEPGTFTVTRPEPQAGIPRNANAIPSVAFGEPPKPPAPELGTPENPGWVANIPNTMPKVPKAAAEAAERTRIATPSEGMGNAQRRVGSEGSAARWKTDDAMRILRDGTSDMGTKREAAMTLTRRGVDLPENYRYLLGDQSFGSSTYNPRDVTKFTPEGEPIRQGGKWKPIQ